MLLCENRVRGHAAVKTAVVVTTKAPQNNGCVHHEHRESSHFKLGRNLSEAQQSTEQKDRQALTKAPNSRTCMSASCIGPAVLEAGQKSCIAPTPQVPGAGCAAPPDLSRLLPPTLKTGVLMSR
mmetsp:Transcript_31720/g.47818  ORF Transcript_31720/g.47818 Transcript_31720/m.47818 type:complete len:124 (+) Transcript_31720:103-474(+)